MIVHPVTASSGLTAPPGFTQVGTGSRGGMVLAGVFPDPSSPQPLRSGYVYLPPGAGGGRRYPVVYLLHGMPGDPNEYVDALHLADVADELISTGAVRPFIAVVPAAGTDPHYNGEWAGPWERYVVRAVVPWVDTHLPTVASRSGRVLAGLSAGGFGAVDIGLRNPELFGRLESWSGYFHPLPDGPFAHAKASVLAANDPTRLVRAAAPRLRRLGTRFFLGTGPTHSHWFKAQETVDFAHLVKSLRLPETLHVLPVLPGEWGTQLDMGLRWALGGR